MQGINPMVFCAPWDDSYLHNWINPPNLDNKTLMTLLLKNWDDAQIFFKVLTQWDFVTIWPTIIYKTE